MDELNSFLGQDALETLTCLEERAEQLTSEQSTVQEQLSQLQTSRERIIQLRARRDELKARAHKPFKGPLSLLTTDNGERSSLDARQEALLVKRHKLEERKNAYRLLGQSLSMVDAHTVRICWDTSCDGEYYAPYYAELLLNIPPHPVLKRHTLPPFLPLDDTRERLKQGLTVFMDYVQRHLQAYRVRRNFTQLVQKQYAQYLVGPLEATPSVDWVNFTVTPVPLCRDATVILCLKFDDATAWLPTHVKVHIQDRDDSSTEVETLSEIEDTIELFTSKDLPIAMQIFTQQR